MPMFSDMGTANQYHNGYVGVFPKALEKSYNAVIEAIKNRDDITLDNEFIQRLEKIKPVLSLAGLLKNDGEMLPAVNKIRESTNIPKEIFGQIYTKLLEIINPKNAKIGWTPEGTIMYFNNKPALENKKRWEGSFYEILDGLISKCGDKIKIDEMIMVTPDFCINQKFGCKDYEIWPGAKQYVKEARELLKRTVQINKYKDEFTKEEGNCIKEPNTEQLYQIAQLLYEKYNEKFQITKLGVVVPANTATEYIENPNLNNITIEGSDFTAEMTKAKESARIVIKIKDSTKLAELQKEFRNSIKLDMLYNTNEPDRLLSTCHAYSSALCDVIKYVLENKMLKGKTPSLEEVVQEIEAKPRYAVSSFF